MTDLTPLASDTQEDLPIQAIFSRRQVLKGTGTIAASTAFASLATKATQQHFLTPATMVHCHPP